MVNILIADSDSERIDSYRHILEKEEYNILAARNKIDFLRTYKERSSRNQKIDAIVIDLGMSGAYGIIIEFNNEIPIVAVSGCERQRESARDFGARYFIRTSCKNDLADVIRKALQPKPQLERV